MVDSYRQPFLIKTLRIWNIRCIFNETFCRKSSRITNGICNCISCLQAEVITCRHAKNFQFAISPIPCNTFWGVFILKQLAIIEFDFLRIWSILQIMEAVIPSKICRILHILRNPNSTLLYYLFKIFKTFVKRPLTPLQL